MKTKIMMVALTLLAIVGKTKAENSISLENASGAVGTNVSLHLSITNDFVASGFQFYLSLPEGVTIDCEEEDWDTTSRTKKFSVLGNKSEGVYKFSVFSLTGSEIKGNEGEVLVINLKIGSSVEAKDYEMKVTNAILFEVGSTKDYRVDDCTAILSISGDISTSIDSAMLGASENKDVYSVNGMKISDVQKGINIVKTKDGKVKKMLVK